MPPFLSEPQTEALIGLGLRHPHIDEALSNNPINNNIDFIEIHAENFFAAGGITQALLQDTAQRYKISVHGTSLGLGSALKVPAETLEKFARVVKNANAFLVSEHLCFNRVPTNSGVFHSGDLLPLAYNQQALDTICSNIHQVQDTLKRPILIENLSAYVLPSQLHEQANDSMSEQTFLVSMAEKSGCGLLLDLNNLIVNALNQGVDDPVTYIFKEMSSLPTSLVGEIHLAGFSDTKLNGFIVDDHANFVSEQCWQLYELIIAKLGPKPTLIEWDNELPSWAELVGEAGKAKKIAGNISHE